MKHPWIIRIALRCALLCFIVAQAEEVFNTMPPPFESKFSCSGKKMGFYADVEANCKVYHTCDDYGNKFTYRCPQETAFRQDALICDHAHLVDCQKTMISKERTSENPHHVPAISLEPPRDHRSFSRSFHIVGQPTKPQLTSTDPQPGFVLSTSLFLRDRSTTIESSSSHGKDAQAASTFIRTSANSANSQRPAEERRLAYSTERTTTVTQSTDHRSRGGQSLHDATTSQNAFSNARSRDYYPYSETLRSIQANNNWQTTSTTTPRPSSTTTQLSVHALTLSLKPLVPNELEYDPYYPKMPTSTEAYYTPHQRNTGGKPSFRSTTPPSWENVHFEIPAVLPDLNSLEDLVDRRKLFFIPRLKAT